MGDATYLLRGTAMNLMKDDDTAGHMDEKSSTRPIDDAHCSDPPFLADSSHLVCSNPPIWIFDGLLSDTLLQYVDASFEGINWQSMNGRQVRMVEFGVDEQLRELTQTLRDISQIDDVGPCSNAWIMDVHGRPQGAHVDGWELERNRDRQFLDLSKCSVQSHNGFDTIIPTLSFVVYFNDSGGCAFPKAALPHPVIPAKRGRILMFQNYFDAERPAHNPNAVHYGVYGDVPKRVMTAGVMSNETPFGLSSSQRVDTSRTQGFLYAPIMHRSNTSCGDIDRTPTPPRKPAPPPPKPKPVLQLLARLAEEGGYIVEATNLGGQVVSKTLVQASATLGELRKSLGVEGKLVSKSEVLDGKDEKLLCHNFVQGMEGPVAKETALVKFIKDKQGPVGVQDASQERARGADSAEREAAARTSNATKRAVQREDAAKASQDTEETAWNKDISGFHELICKACEEQASEDKGDIEAAHAYAAKEAQVGDFIQSISDFRLKSGKVMPKGASGKIMNITDGVWQVDWGGSRSWVGFEEQWKFKQDMAEALLAELAELDLVDAEAPTGSSEPKSSALEKEPTKEFEWDVIDTLFVEKGSDPKV